MSNKTTNLGVEMVKNGQIFKLDEAALAYALAAERILDSDAAYLESHAELVPIFVTLLFQSLEISIKYVGIESGLTTDNETRALAVKRGHGIEELAKLVVKKLNGEPFDPLIQALTSSFVEPVYTDIIRNMIHGEEFKSSRSAYATRALGYAEVGDGDFALVSDLGIWVAAVKQTAIDLPKAVSIVRQWRHSNAKPGPFAIWQH